MKQVGLVINLARYGVFCRQCRLNEIIWDVYYKGGK